MTHLTPHSPAKRLSEAKALRRLLPAGPTLLLGDLNALTRADYDDAQWQLHESHRRERGWEPPAEVLVDAGTRRTVGSGGARFAMRCEP